jgi:hypothetical protein
MDEYGKTVINSRWQNGGDIIQISKLDATQQHVLVIFAKDVGDPIYTLRKNCHITME